MFFVIEWTIKENIEFSLEFKKIDPIIKLAIYSAVAKKINTPRLHSFRGMTRAKTAQIITWKGDDIGVEKEEVGLAGSATQVIKIFFPQRTHQAEMFKGDVETQVDALVGKLKEAKLI